MSDHHDDQSPAPAETAPTETPIQRALREKQEAIAARAKPPRGGRFQREQAARVKSGAVRPWSTK
ncbi:hypothetical protein HNP32_002681 [Brevundimonas bullata]|jgi:hypothetical protein|uniref:Uncharacterized protein n=1 Tax=Brevundimonas bullata TaxID=13160 RepID=A0A7W7IRJ5_9CAUL|nr:hypothetical protein [Brevundimonas bullata]MBB4798927.1 hypothetical protein [Brevundimonas bullata]MBB6383887.1 hypothetical protein [Brevundimonas bullata]